MRFRISGCRKDNGQDVQFDIEAPNAAWAERMAQQRGILISSVEPASASPSATPPPEAQSIASARPSGTKPARPRTARAVPSAPAAAPPPSGTGPLPVDDPFDADLAALAEGIPAAAEPSTAVAAATPAVPKPRQKRVTQPAGEESDETARGWKRKPAGWAMTLGGVLCCAVMLWSLYKYVSGGFSGAGGFDSYRVLAPPDTQWVAYFDVDKLRGSQAYADLKDRLELSMDKLPLQTAEGLDDFSQIFAAGGQNPAVLVIRTRTDHSNGELSGYGMEDDESRIVAVEGVKCVVTPKAHRWIARLASCTFLLTSNEADMRDALRRRNSSEPRKFSPEMESLIASLRGHDHIAVMQPTPGAFPIPMPMQAAGVGFSVGSQVKLATRIVFMDEQAAQQVAEAAKSAADAPAAPASAGASAAQPPMALSPQLARGIACNRTGKTVEITGSWSYAELKPLFAEPQQLMRSALRMGGPGLPADADDQPEDGPTPPTRAPRLIPR